MDQPTSFRRRRPNLLDFKIAHVYRGPYGRDPRVRMTIDVLARKGFLRTHPLPQPYRGLLTLADVLWACEHALPYFYELVPALRLRFPKHAPGPVPADLREVLRALQSGATDGPDYHGYPYPDLRRWLDHPVRDRRSARRLLTRVQVKLPPALLVRIRTAAALRKMNTGEWITAVAEGALSASGKPPRPFACVCKW